MTLGYVAYIDEAGDDGLYSPLRPNHPTGASEWMAMSAIVVRLEHDGKTVEWVKQIIRDLEQPQLTRLHFRKLRDDKKLIVCNALAGLPLRCFTVLLRNPRQSGHRFRRKAATHSDRKRPPNPIEGGHPVDRVNWGSLSAI
jgi:hypothetical protein